VYEASVKNSNFNITSSKHYPFLIFIGISLKKLDRVTKNKTKNDVPEIVKERLNRKVKIVSKTNVAWCQFHQHFTRQFFEPKIQEPKCN